MTIGTIKESGHQESMEENRYKEPRPQRTGSAIKIATSKRVNNCPRPQTAENKRKRMQSAKQRDSHLSNYNSSRAMQLQANNSADLHETEDMPAKKVQASSKRLRSAMPSSKQKSAHPGNDAPAPDKTNLEIKNAAQQEPAKDDQSYVTSEKTF